VRSRAPIVASLVSVAFGAVAFGAVALAATIAGSVVAGCGNGGRPPGPTVDAGPIIRPLTAQSVVAYEGMTRFVTVIDTEPGLDLSGATIRPRDDGGSLVVREAVCRSTACAVHLEIVDRTAPRAIPVPRPIDSINELLLVELGATEMRQVLITVWPCDAITNSGTPARVRGVHYASSATSELGGSFGGAPDGDPVRWLVFGDVTLRGDLDVSGVAEAVAGGGAGGAISSAGSGAGGGGAGSASSGGGGGAGLGSPGDGAPGEGSAPGAGGSGGDRACVLEFDTLECGGSGGGGAAGEGGAGGGVFVIASLGDVVLGGAIRARGGDGAASGGGGGGGGGAIVIAGVTVEAEVAEIDVAGGAGATGGSGSAGGAGGGGRIEIDSAAATGARGIGFDVAGADLIVESPTYVVRGRAPAGEVVEIQSVDLDVEGTAMADASGAFEITVMLAPGLNRLRLSMEGTWGLRRAWNGNAFEFAREGSATVPTPVGGLLDVAYVPAS
jgi:hypothetical protein